MQQRLAKSVGGDKQLAGAIAGRIKLAGDNGLQPDDIKKFVGGLPPDQQATATNFFAGPFQRLHPRPAGARLGARAS